jgi:hypothetical protein
MQEKLSQSSVPKFVRKDPSRIVVSVIDPVAFVETESLS